MRTPFARALTQLLRRAAASERIGIGLDELDSRRERLRLHRRAFLASTAAIGAGACAPRAAEPTAPRSGSGPDPSKRNLDVAVVGGGTAGLHAALRLAQAGLDVRLFEASERLGGRMYTTQGFLDEQLIERGGEFVDTNHRVLFALASEFRLQLDDLAKAQPEGIDSGNLYFIGGQKISERQILDSFKNLMPAIVAAPAEGPAYERLDREYSMQSWLEKHADPLLVRVMAPAYVPEFGLEMDEMSVLPLIETFRDGMYEDDGRWALFGDSDEAYHFHRGSDAVPRMLAQALGPGRIEMGQPLAALARKADAYRLSFAGGGEVSAKRVVLALPFSTLRLVDLSRAGFSARKLEMIRALGYGTNSKLMSGYRVKSWHAAQKHSGAVITDLGDGPGAEIQNLWDTSLGQPGDAGILTNFVGGRAGITMGKGTDEEQWRKRLIHADALLPGLGAAYIAGKASRELWPSSRWALGSYACYKPGQAVNADIAMAVEGGVHFCGEHTSVEVQGFMEGAAESGARAAAEVLKRAGVAYPIGLERAMVARREAGSDASDPEWLRGVGGLQQSRGVLGAVRKQALSRNGVQCRT